MESTTLNLEKIQETVIDGQVKGIPGGVEPFPLGQIAQQSWNVLREDLPFPLMVLKQSALENNLQVMQSYLQERNASLAPHGKTTMAPQLFDLQLRAGAWGITVSTVNQIQVCRDFGVQRVLLANQLVGRQNVRYVVQEINADPRFDFYCLVDSPELVKQLAGQAKEFKLQRPLKVLLEGGFVGGRTGCRTREEAREVLSRLRDVQDLLLLAGVEGFEGILSLAGKGFGGIAGEFLEELTRAIDSYLFFVTGLLEELKPTDLPGATEIILTAGGSAYFDRVIEVFEQADFFLPKRIVLRSGCYLTHDSGVYERFHDQLERRGWKGKLRPALEIWSLVQSLPETGLAILTMGKRDCPYDMGFPRPQKVFRADSGERELEGCKITALNDQHAYMEFPRAADLRVGDMIASGISHPCTAFDKWRFIPVVNDDYDVIDGILTFF